MRTAESITCFRKRLALDKSSVPGEEGAEQCPPPPAPTRHTLTSYLTRTICLQDQRSASRFTLRESQGNRPEDADSTVKPDATLLYPLSSVTVAGKPLASWLRKGRVLDVPFSDAITVLFLQSLMMHPIAPHWMGLSLAVWSGSGSAAPFRFQILTEGSAAEEETGTSAPARFLTTRPQAPGGQPDGREATALEELVRFLHGNLLFLLIGASVVLVVVLLIVCGAALLKRKWRINAYYPCSFPSKMYVEQRDKAGGVKRFDPVPQKASVGQEGEPVDSGQRLHQDILRAAKSLRTPNKQPPQGGGHGDDTDANSPSPKTAESSGLLLLLDKEPANGPEEDETGRPSETREASNEAEEQELPLVSPEQTGQEEVQCEEPPGSGTDPSAVQPDHRPTSQLIHSCDSPALPLITGEKTAF
ncbi:Transmembrane protein 119 [Merluccius polli]|uniref:Transmembrane protein 119 n=1 Tax=Merluccius polli TaxID=89951 RepID=A0AA47MKZ0_MERPO|nr:Transmembrane protein 119 [Merluccius polli]